MRLPLLTLLLLLLCDLHSSHPPYHPKARPKRGSVEDPPTSDAQTEQEEKPGDGRVCYFKVERKTSDEKEPRPVHSKVGPCGGDLRRMSQLAEDDYPTLHGSPNPAALVIGRGGGEFIDWEDPKQVKSVGERWICKRHEDELGLNWGHKDYYHFKRKQEALRFYYECSISAPFSIHQPPKVLYTDVHRIDAEEAQAILMQTKTLFQIGLPICPKHEKEVRAMVKGHDLRNLPNLPHSPLPEDQDTKDSSFYLKRKKPTAQEASTSAATKEEVKKAYIAFMNALGLSPHISTTPWNNLSSRSQRRQSEALRFAAHEMATIMNPDDPKSLEDKTFKSVSDEHRTSSELYEGMMMNVKEAFEHSDSRADRLAFLSMIVHFPLPEIQRFLPGLSRYYYVQAKRYARRGYHFESVTHRRIKYSFAKSERFLEFLTGYKISLGMSYGTRRVKDTLGRWVEIPNTLRRLRSGEIYHLYKKELEDEHETHLLLPESTLRKMIHICSAETRKSLHGVDVIVADAMEAYDDAEIFIDKMHESNWIDKSWHSSLRSKGSQSRQYFRTDYLVHTKQYSTISDHCWTYAVSDPNILDFQQDCKAALPDWVHKHTRMCNQCEVEMEKRGKDDKQRMHEIAIAKRDIADWEDKIHKLKAHQLRTAKSEKERQKIIAGLEARFLTAFMYTRNSEGDVLYTGDFAMKLLPMNPLEPSTDWYAQRGMVWHVAHYTTKRNGDYYQHRTVHILKGDRQDSAVVTAVIRHNLEDLQRRGIKRVIMRSDQAGAYKSSSTIASIAAMAQEVQGINVEGYYFSEAQAGKGPCDRDAATLKGHLRGYVDGKGKVLNPKQFYEGAISGKPLAGFSFHLATVEGTGADKEVKLSSTKIDDLSKMTAFEFEKDHVRMYRSWEIGAGKLVSSKKFVPNDARLDVEKSGGALSDEEYWQRLGDPHYKEKEHDVYEEEDEDTHCEKEEKKCVKRPRLESTLYRCPIETCAQEFLSAKNFEKHVAVDKHLRRPERYNIQDFALHRFADWLEMVAPPKVCPVIDDALASLMDDNPENEKRLLMGWALPKRRTAGRFPPTVKNFLKKIYDEGDKSGVKTDAREAAVLMRQARNPDGSMMFVVEHLLNSRQIAGVYTGFKRTKLEKRARTAAGSRDKREETAEPDEVNDLFDTEGDPELAYKWEPLFDNMDLMRVAIKKGKVFREEGESEDVSDTIEHEDVYIL